MAGIASESDERTADLHGCPRIKPGIAPSSNLVYDAQSMGFETSLDLPPHNQQYRVITGSHLIRVHLRKIRGRPLRFRTIPAI